MFHFPFSLFFFVRLCSIFHFPLSLFCQRCSIFQFIVIILSALFHYPFSIVLLLLAFVQFSTFHCPILLSAFVSSYFVLLFGVGLQVNLLVCFTNDALVDGDNSVGVDNSSFLVKSLLLLKNTFWLLLWLSFFVGTNDRFQLHSESL